jgi:hypothetical protein
LECGEHRRFAFGLCFLPLFFVRPEKQPKPRCSPHSQTGKAKGKAAMLAALQRKKTKAKGKAAMLAALQNSGQGGSGQ